MFDLAPRVKKIKPSSTLAITAKAKQMEQEGKDIVNFAAGEPDFDTPDYIKQSAIKAIRNGFTKYTPSTGILELKQAVCKYLLNSKGVRYSPNQIVIGCGAKHCLYNVLQVICSAGDKVIIPAPYWVSYPEMVKLAEAEPVIVKTSRRNEFKINSIQLKKAIDKDTKAFILNSPLNPTGSIYSKQDLLDLISVLKSNNIYIISDEIYDQLYYKDKVNSIISLDKNLKDRIILIGGVSKTYAMTGWRIGYLAATEKIVQSIANLQSHSTSNPCSISQMAALAALSKPGSEISQMVRKFDERRKLMYSKLKKIPKLGVFKPQGGFYIFCDISKYSNDSLDFAQKLLDEKNVAVIPGIAFGCEGFVRMSFATSIEQINKGVDRINEWLSRGK